MLVGASVFDDDALHDTLGLPKVGISGGVAKSLGIGVHDLVHVSDRRRWLGGLKSTHAVVASVDENTPEPQIQVGQTTARIVGLTRRPDQPFGDCAYLLTWR